MAEFVQRLRKQIRHLSRRRWPHFLLFPIVFLWDELLLRLFDGISLWRNLLYPVIFALSAGLFVSALTSLFHRRINRRISIVVLAVTALYFTVECILKRTFQLYISIAGIVSGAGNVVANYGSNVISAIAGGAGIIFLFFLPLLLYLWRGRKQMPAFRYTPVTAVILLVLCLLIGGIGVLFATHMPSTKDLYAAQFNYDTATQTFGLLTSSRLDLRYSIFGNKAADTLTTTTTTATDEPDVEEADIEEEDAGAKYGYNEMDIDFTALAGEADNEDIKGMDEYVASLEPSNKNKYTGLFEGKNLIFITAEAFAMQVIDEELTPTLYRLSTQGINFTDFYQPAWEGGTTITGEFANLLSLVPTNETDSLLDTANDNLYFSMGNQLQREGYYSLAFHNGDYDYYNRDQTHYNLGYDDYLAWGHELDDYLEWWSGDQATVEATMPLYIDEQPFDVYYMSYSGHASYKADDWRTTENLDRVKEVLGDKYKDTTLYYFCYQLEFEHALESMVDELEEKGIADDTVIVISADHYPYGLAKSSTFNNSEDYLLDLYQVDDYDCFIRDRNAGIIWSGCIEDMNLTVDTPAMTLDILPTLSNLFGLEFDSRLLVGRDVFSDAMPLVFWPGGSFLTEEGRYDENTGEFEAFEGKTVDDNYVNTIKEIVNNKISFSRQVIRNDYYGYLFGKDTVTDSAQVRGTTITLPEPETDEEEDEDEDENGGEEN